MSEIVERINSIAVLSDIVSDFIKLKKYCRNQKIGICPFCGADGKNKGLVITDSKAIYKCFQCGEGGSGVINFLKSAEKYDFKDAIKYLCDRYHIEQETEDARNKRLNYEVSLKKSKGIVSFRDTQLKAVGLTDDDIRVKAIEDGSKLEIIPFRTGTVDQYYRLIEGDGDDMIIYYYDLEGKQVTFKSPKKSKEEIYFRVRFQNPELRLSKDGKPIRYYSPAGSGTHLYIPEKIRTMYIHNRNIDRLFIQEGEKKAEKASKHGILSVGVMGIQNIGNNQVVPLELQLLIKNCNVKEIVFVLDSDWNSLSQNLIPEQNVQQRPYNFFIAIRNYKDYMVSLRNNGINLEIYFGAIKVNPAEDKGIDDVLANTLKGKEETLKDDIEFAINAKDGQGNLIEVHRITGLTEYQIKDFWKLNNANEFTDLHLERLKELPEFTIYKTKYRIGENGKLELAEPILNEEKYWTEDSKGRISFNYKRSYNFLRNRGFGRLKMTDDWRFISYKNNIVEVVDRTDIKDFVTNVTEQIASEEVQNMIFQGGHFYFGPHSLENLKYFDVLFEQPSKNSHRMHFNNKFWTITENGITEHSPAERDCSIWKDVIINFDVKLLTPFISFFKIDDAYLDNQNGQGGVLKKFKGLYAAEMTSEGEECHFLKFLINTSNFNWNNKNYDPDHHTIEHCIDVSTHLISKLTAMGYLVHSYRDASVAKCVIGMDGKLCEVGASNGRSGKSLFGIAIEKILPTVYIPGKGKNLTDDPFIFEEVTEKTRFIFIDDVRANIDFEFFFPIITGKMKVNAKGIGRWEMPKEATPKLYISTNHAINGSTSSFRDRQHNIAFSDFYNENHKPTDDFGCLFFDEWDAQQWNMFYNLVGLSVQLYLKFGLVQSPGRELEQRRLRQEMGEDFLTWAEEFFSRDVTNDFTGTSNFGARLPRHTLYSDFLTKNARASKWMTPTRFGKCIRWYCEYKAYHFNPSKLDEKGHDIGYHLEHDNGVFFGERDVTHGSEYFTVGFIPDKMP